VSVEGMVMGVIFIHTHFFGGQSFVNTLAKIAKGGV